MKLKSSTRIALIAVAYCIPHYAAAQFNQWDETMCQGYLQGYANPQTDIPELVASLRAKVESGDDSEQTFELLTHLRDVEWYCLKFVK